MKILLAPNAFKECLSAADVAAALEAGIRRARPEATIVSIPVADGGDGFLHAVVQGARGVYRMRAVTHPFRGAANAQWGLIHGGRTAVIEMAEASGLRLLRPDQRKPLQTTSRGTGDLLRVAVEEGVEEILVGLGGSGTVDGGIGMAAVLGYRFLDAEGRALPAVGGSLSLIRHIDASRVLAQLRYVRIRAAVDVGNPLCGPGGAARVFGPQKGASPEEVEALDAGLANLAACLERDLGRGVRDLAGAGAAGGTGAGLAAFCGARLEPGIDVVLDAVGFAAALDGADLVLTGEGRVDEQTLMGKAPAGVARMAAAKGIPVICVAGAIAPGLNADHLFERIVNINPEGSPREERFARAGERLADAAERIAAALDDGRI